jgi:hypothetical protein
MNPHNHLKTDQMESVLHILYEGSTAMEEDSSSVAVLEENVSSFLAVAADLMIVGWQAVQSLDR